QRPGPRQRDRFPEWTFPGAWTIARCNATAGGPMRLKDKVAIITGAGQGIGRAYANRFAREGAKIVVAEINEEIGRRTESEVKAAGGTALFVKTDVGSEASTTQMAATAAEHFGSIDI